jgi:hypothetical protein
MAAWLFGLGAAFQAIVSCAGTAMSPLSHVAWMDGCWVTSDGETTTEECWVAGRGPQMLGVNWQKKAGQIIFFELLRIKKTKSGIYYVARPKGGKATRFLQVRFTRNSVVFDNPTHDFPNRITYQLSADGKLHAIIEGKPGGKPKKVEWVFQKRKSGD